MIIKDIFVSGGSFSSPFYKFYHDNQGNEPIENLSFDIFTSYRFYRLNNVSSHPFYIKDSLGSDEGLNFVGDGSKTSGIKNEETFLLFFDSEIDLGTPISYFCTSHPSMNFDVNLNAFEKIVNVENNSLENSLEIGKNYFLSSIRDFDGNFHANIGSVSDDTKTSYKYQGLVDVNADGVKEAIYTNKESGRWVTTSINPSTGEIDYSDHGEGGITRIVGIYEDPLIAEGSNNGGFLSDSITPAPANFGVSDKERYVVVNGETIDRLALNSQVRFQNDLKIDNLIAKTSGDYDGDGFQEVYWKTNDGTAYLRALMHADGNIQYANYQSESQMSDYLTSMGFESEISEII